MESIQSNWHGERGRDGRSAILGKECALAGLTVLLIQDRDGLLPAGVLGVVDLTQIKDVTLLHVASEAAALDDGPRAVFLTVLFAGAALEQQAPWVVGMGLEGSGKVATSRTFETVYVEILNKSASFHSPNPQKSSTPTASSGSQGKAV